MNIDNKEKICSKLNTFVNFDYNSPEMLDFIEDIQMNNKYIKFMHSTINKSTKRAMKASRFSNFPTLVLPTIEEDNNN